MSKYVIKDQNPIHKAGGLDELLKINKQGIPIEEIISRITRSNTEVDLDLFITEDPLMLELKQRIIKIKAFTKNHCSVLITGPTGTGKELLARALAKEADAPFVARNCAGFPKELIASMLFGHLRGTFTGADSDRHGILHQAKHGIVFLDEIADFPIELQATLLRALQERKVCRLGAVESIPIECRFVGATKFNLRERVEQGLFREDLFARLMAFELHITGLIDRPSDILLIAAQGCDQVGEPLDWPKLAKALQVTEDTILGDNVLPDIYRYNVRGIQTFITRMKTYGHY